MLKVVSVVGARPQFVKVAPVIRAAREAGLQHLIVHTGQHYDYQMSDVFFRELELPAPAHHLEVGSGSHAQQTGTMMQRLEPVLAAESPDWVLVYGDTNSTAAGALTSAKLGFRLAHVEAGLRSFNRAMPEEINRVVTDHLSTILFCPTSIAVANCRAEGFGRVANDGALTDDETLNGVDRPTPNDPVVVNCGDVMYDAILLGSQVAQKRSTIVQALRLEPRQYYLATIHRAQNADDRQVLARLVSGLGRLGRPVVFPVHPRTAAAIRQAGIDVPASIHVIDPLGYFDMLALESSAAAILTDSGGVQKEAFFFRVPCVTLRDETEWTETVATGWNTLVGSDVEKLVDVIHHLTCGNAETAPYGAGQAARTIVRCLARFPRTDR